jgi:hypothetical protein
MYSSAFGLDLQAAASGPKPPGPRALEHEDAPLDQAGAKADGKTRRLHRRRRRIEGAAPKRR